MDKCRRRFESHQGANPSGSSDGVGEQEVVVCVPQSEDVKVMLDKASSGC